MTTSAYEKLEKGFYLGGWEVQPLEGRIVGASGPVHVEPLVMKVLLALASRPGEVVQRNELVDKVWDGRAISDSPINRCIAELRRLLEDSRTDPRFVETLSKRGYRLIAPVRFSDENAESPETAAGVDQPDFIVPLHKRLLARFAGIPAYQRGAGVIAVTALVAWAMISSETSRPVPVPEPEPGLTRPAGVLIAVLPFTDMSDAGAGGSVVDGLAEEIRTRLALITGLGVIGSHTASSLKENDEDAAANAEDLGITHRINGSARRSGDRIRVAVELTDARGVVVWPKTYEGVIDDVFAMQDTIANDIVAQLRSTLPLPGSVAPISTAPPTESMDAYNLVVRGRESLALREEGPLREAIELFDRAIKLDDRYAEAYVGLATAYALLPFYSYESVNESFSMAKAVLAEGAMRNPLVDEKSAGITAFMLFRTEWNWIESDVGFRRALRLSPQDAELLQWYSQFLGSVGRQADALEYAIQARLLDPRSPVPNHRLAIAYLWAGQDELARKQYALAEELGIAPQAVPEPFFILLLRSKEYETARSLMAAHQMITGRSTDWIDPVLRAMKNPAQIPAAIEAVERAEKDNQISLQYLFGLWVYLGETDRAIDTALLISSDRRSFGTEFLFIDETRELRRNPRFNELVRSVGLHRYWDHYGWPEMCRRDEDERIVCS